MAHLNHREETAAVRKALKAAGLVPLEVSHGRGTAWGWLHVTVEGPEVPLHPDGSRDILTPEGQERDRLERVAREAVERATGRDSSKDDMMTDLFLSQYIIKVRPREVV